MTDRDRELMERYIYQVVRRLPKDQREETALELQELIGDMLEEDGSAMEDVLTKLGDPAKFAERYQDVSRCLIGPEYYDTYLWFVKVVLLCSMLPVFAVGFLYAVRKAGPGSGYAGAYATNSVISEAVFMLGSLLGAVFDALSAGIAAFGAVTLIFVILEWQKVKLDRKRERQWKVDDLGTASGKSFSGWTPGVLSPVPHPKARISRGDCIVEIIFTVVLGVLLIFAPHFFAVIFPKGEGGFVIPLLNLEQWDMILPVFILSLAIGLMDNVVRLAVGVYGKIVVISSVLCNAVSLVLAVVLLKMMPFWNPDFALELQLYLGGDGEIADWLTHWNGDTASSLLLAVIVFAVILDSGTVIYKTLRYGRLR